MTESKGMAPVIKNWNGKWRVNEMYRPIAESLVKKFPELEHVPVDTILFVDNVESKPRRKGKRILVQIGLVPGRWCEILRQLSGFDVWYVMEVFKKHVAGLSPAQITALVYHELRHIGENGSLIDHDIADWWNMVNTLGPGWNHPDANIPDLLAPNVDWDSIAARNLFGEPGADRDKTDETVVTSAAAGREVTADMDALRKAVNDMQRE